MYQNIEQFIRYLYKTYNARFIQYNLCTIMCLCLYTFVKIIDNILSIIRDLL